MKSSRDNILAAIAKNKPSFMPAPAVEKPAAVNEDLLELFSQTAVSIGSRVYPVKRVSEIEDILQESFPEGRVVSRVEGLSFGPKEKDLLPQDPHAFEDVELAVLEGELAVAENSAIWIRESSMGHRVLPFICQHLALVIRKEHIVANMHQAYEQLGKINQEGFGVFIAGPSKTADIEQSLVLGAHGPRSLRVFVYTQNE